MYAGSYKLKSDNTDPHPDWSERKSIIWGARLLLAFLALWSFRIATLANENFYLLIGVILFGVICILTMTAIELQRLRVTKSKEEKDTQHGP